MVSVNTRGLVSTGALVLGALLVGDAINRSVVTGEVAVTAPAVVLPALAGVVFIYVGYRVKPDPDAYAGTATPDRSEADGEPAPDAAGSEEFDPELSPLGDAAPGDAAARDGDDPREGDEGAESSTRER